ncbi:R1A1-element\ORF2 [Symbiodinium sp. CCMP2592]|nr:R1A1-element\ORF2 [Symbiodinium sp. CCMP2592]
MSRGKKRDEPMPAEDVSVPSSSGDEGDRSPKRTGPAPDAPVTLRALRSILAEQTKQLTDLQAGAVDKAVHRLEKTLETRLAEVDSRAEQMDARVGALEKQIEELLQQGAGMPKFQGLGGDDGARRARTLVYGGWPRESRRKVILQELQEHLDTLGVASLVDHEPFTTGARRSMALSGFQQRAGESFQDMRSRMHKIVLAFSSGNITNKQGGRIWCSYSKSKAEREKGSHAGWVKRASASLLDITEVNLDIEWQTGSVWCEDALVASSDLPVPPGTDMRGVIVREDQDAKPWVSFKLLAAGLKQKEKEAEDCDSELRVLGWNLGGVEVQDLPRTIADAAPLRMEKDSLLLLQEYPRGVQGWAVEKHGSWTVVTHRHGEAWRGSGLMYCADAWCLTRRVCTAKGTWFRLRSISASEDVLWVGTAHLTPGSTVAVFESEVEDHFQALPASAKRVVFQGDVNTPFQWIQERASVTAVAREGKGGLLQKALHDKGLVMIAPVEGQLSTPTCRPRQAGRTGQHIDIFASKGLHANGTHIHVDSYLAGGTDHELLHGCFRSTWCRRIPRRCTRARVVCGTFGIVNHIDQPTLADFASTHTKPAPSRAYRDPPEVRELFKKAKQRGTPALWKAALKARKVARKAWEAERLQRAAGGDWDAIREVKGARNEGWDVEFALHQQGDPHEAIHRHFQGVDSSHRRDPVVHRSDEEVRGFTIEELWVGIRQLKGRKAAGKDFTSRELLEGICHAEGGAEHVVEFFNRVLVSQEVPTEWNEPLLVMLPKVLHPRCPRELRPIALGSSVGKLFSRLLLNRCLEKIQLQYPPQCAGVHRQTNDFTYSLIRLFELEREWQGGMAALKVDISRAFDDVDRDVLVAKLAQKLGPGPELQCWKSLLANNAATLSTPFGESTINIGKGIKQGGIESPAFFSMLMELAVRDAEVEYDWMQRQRLYPDLSCPDAALFMDDGVLWTLGTKALQQRVSELSRVLLRYGLKVNLAKCQLYCAPCCPGPPLLRVEGQVLHASDHLCDGCRAKFWEIRHILRAQGGTGNLLGIVQGLQTVRIHDFHTVMLLHMVVPGDWACRRLAWWENQSFLVMDRRKNLKVGLIDSAVGDSEVSSFMQQAYTSVQPLRYGICSALPLRNACNGLKGSLRIYTAETGDRDEVQHGTVDDDEEDALSVFSVKLMLFTPTLAAGFDEPFGGGPVPQWWWDMIDDVRGLMDRGRDGKDLSRRLHHRLRMDDDNRFIEDTLLYVNGLSRALHIHQPIPLDPAQALPVPHDEECEDIVDAIIRRLKRKWLWAICPIAMQNQREEEWFLNAGYGHVELSVALRDAEAEERRGLSRSRSPHRRVREQWLAEEVTEMEEDANLEADTSSLMDVRGGRGRDGRSRSMGCGGGMLVHVATGMGLPTAVGSWNGDQYTSGLPHRTHMVEEGGGIQIGIHVCGNLLGRPLGSDILGPSASTGPSIDVTDAMEFWRRHILVPEGSDGLPVSHGGPIIENARYRHVLMLLRDRSEADRAVLSIGVVSFIRAIMVELGELCHEACLQMVDLAEREPEPEADTVEVPVEEDEAGFMQTTLDGIKRDSIHEKWQRLLTRLQSELAGQEEVTRGHHVNCLLGHVRRLGPMPEDGPAAQLQALLLAMAEPHVAAGSSGNDGCDCWTSVWISSLASHVPGLRMEPENILNDSLDERALLAAAEEAEGQLRGHTEETRLDSDATAEYYFMKAQEQAVLQHQASNYRDWEQWEMDRALARHVESEQRARQIVVQVSAKVTTSGSSTGPGLGREWRMEVPSSGSLDLAIRVTTESMTDPDEVATQLTPDTKRRCRDLQVRARQEADAEPQLDYGQYAQLYERWLGGLLNDKQVVNLYGKALLGYFEAQFATTEGVPARPLPVSQDDSPDDELMLGPLGYGEYERAYGLWKDGWLKETQIMNKHGLAVLNIMTAQRVNGELPPTRPGPDGGMVIDIPLQGVPPHEPPPVQGWGHLQAAEGVMELSESGHSVEVVATGLVADPPATQLSTGLDDDSGDTSSGVVPPRDLYAEVHERAGASAEVVAELRRRVEELEGQLMQARPMAQPITQFSFSDEGVKCKAGLLRCQHDYYLYDDAGEDYDYDFHCDYLALVYSALTTSIATTRRTLTTT